MKITCHVVTFCFFIICFFPLFESVCISFLKYQLYLFIISMLLIWTRYQKKWRCLLQIPATLTAQQSYRKQGTKRNDDGNTIQEVEAQRVKNLVPCIFEFNQTSSCFPTFLWCTKLFFTFLLQFFTTKLSMPKFTEACKSLDLKKMELLKSMGFHHLLNLSCNMMPKQLITWLANHFDVFTNTFNLPMDLSHYRPCIFTKS